MASTIIRAITKPTAKHCEKRRFPPFSFAMLVLFGTHMVWLLVAGIVLYIIA